MIDAQNLQKVDKSLAIMERRLVKISTGTNSRETIPDRLVMANYFKLKGTVGTDLES